MHFLLAGSCYSTYRPNSLLVGRNRFYFHPAMRARAALSAPDWIRPARPSWHAGPLKWDVMMWWDDGWVRARALSCVELLCKQQQNCSRCRQRERLKQEFKGFPMLRRQWTRNLFLGDPLLHFIATHSYSKGDLIFILAIFCSAFIVTEYSLKFKEGVIVLQGGRI